jgi:hypothetical protein
MSRLLLCCTLPVVLGACKTNRDDCDCPPGEMCVTGVCRSLCNNHEDCPPALSCEGGVCQAKNSDCSLDSDCRNNDLCAESFCRSGLCQSRPAHVGARCPQSGEDPNHDGREDGVESWTGICTSYGACGGCSLPEQSCGLRFVAQPTDAPVGEPNQPVRVS